MQAAARKSTVRERLVESLIPIYKNAMKEINGENPSEQIEANAGRAKEWLSENLSSLSSVLKGNSSTIIANRVIELSQTGKTTTKKQTHGDILE
jgi:hypothetical protein